MPPLLSIGDFYGIDSIIEIMTFLVSFIVAYYSNKVYKIMKDPKYRLFSFGFLMIAISFLFKIIVNLTILHRIQIQETNFIITLAHLRNIDLISFFSNVLYKMFSLIGFLFLFFVETRTKSKEKMFLFLYLGILTIFLSIYFDFIFHLTLVIILFILITHFYENYNEFKSSNTFTVLAGFAIILISQIFFIFEATHPLSYLIGELLMLVGFCFLLVNQIKIKNEQKKNQARSSERHLGNIKKRQGR
jgi:hypothetical protein